MRIINTGKANQGKYICIGENNHGKVERIFYVRVSVQILVRYCVPPVPHVVEHADHGLKSDH